MNITMAVVYTILSIIIVCLSYKLGRDDGKYFERASIVKLIRSTEIYHVSEDVRHKVKYILNTICMSIDERK